MRPFNIMIVDDSKFMRESIINLLKTEQDMNIAAEASNGLEAINTLKSSTIPIDVIIMDIEMPIMDSATPVIMLPLKSKTSIIGINVKPAQKYKNSLAFSLMPEEAIRFENSLLAILNLFFFLLLSSSLFSLMNCS